jgi:HPr kinase/phosphorylase
MSRITLKVLIDEFGLTEITKFKDPKDVEIRSAEVNRPGLQIAAGYFDYFGTDRVQIVGMVETKFMYGQTPDERMRRLDAYFATGFPCLVVARGLEIYDEMKTVSEKYGIPILSTDDSTSRFQAGLIRFLNLHLGPSVSQHGVLVEVYGEGVLIVGESGVGKSETALELVKRGHRLVADDIVEITKVSDKTLIGKSPEIIRHFIEIRGVGFIDVKTLYGVGSVKVTESIDLVVDLEMWDEGKVYDRVGIEQNYINILGIDLPYVLVPVREGRNLAIIIEVAAMNNRQKNMGYNAAKALSDRVFRGSDDKGDYKD